MDPNIFNLIIRVACLYFLAATSETAFRKRLTAIGVLTGAIWLLIFKLALWRAIAIYIGVFKYESGELITGIKDLIQSAEFSNLTDGVILIGIILLFIYTVRYQYRREYGK